MGEYVVSQVGLDLKIFLAKDIVSYNLIVDGNINPDGEKIQSNYG